LTIQPPRHSRRCRSASRGAAASRYQSKSRYTIEEKTWPTGRPPSAGMHGRARAQQECKRAHTLRDCSVRQAGPEQPQRACSKSHTADSSVTRCGFAVRKKRLALSKMIAEIRRAPLRPEATSGHAAQEADGAASDTRRPTAKIHLCAPRSNRSPTNACGDASLRQPASSFRPE